MDGEVVISTKLDTKTFEKQIAEIEYELAQIDYELSHAKEFNLDQRAISEYTKRAEILNNRLIDLRKRQEELNDNNIFKGMGKSIENVIKKISKWALAIFGIRTAYSLVRRAMSSLTQYNEQIGADLDYLQYVLATSLEPVIRVIIDLAYTLLNVINEITISLFDYDFLLNASVDNFKKMSNSAKEMKKTLAGFDEMNIISDNNKSSGVSTPTFDPNKGKKEAEEFISFWDKIIKFWEEDWETAFDNIEGNWNSFFQGIGYLGKGFYDIFKGIIEFVVGLWDMLVALFKGDAKALDKGLKKFIQGIKNIIVGLVEGIIGLALMVLGFLKGIFLDIANGVYNKVIKPIGEWFAKLWQGIKDGVGKAVQWIKDKFKSIVTFFSNIISKIVNLFKTIGTRVGEVIGSAFKRVINAVLRTIENILNTPIRAINSLINTINKIPGINLGKISTFSLPRLAKGTIVNAPGRGVMSPSGNAIYGEAGREAYIPLSDTRLLEELGSTIGKYVTINATIPVYAYNRQVDRQIKRIQADNDFATNR